MSRFQTQRGILQRLVGNDVAVRAQFVVPGRPVVVAPGFVVAGEQAVLIGEAFLHDVSRVGERLRVVPLHLVVLDAVIDQAEQERDVGALPDRRVDGLQPPPSA